jgi:Tfp pilus assembly protein FimT
MIGSLTISTSTRSRRRALRWRAFTTFELITVVTIMMIVSVTTISGFRLFQGAMPLRGTATRLAHVFSAARSFAIANNTFYQVTLDLDRDVFWIDELADDGSGVITAAKIVSPESTDDLVTIEGIHITGNPFPLTGSLIFVTFNPDGSSDTDANVYIVPLNDPTSQTYTVRLYAATGHNRVFPRRL